MGADLDRAEREQYLRLSRRVFRCLQIFTERVLGFGQVLQLGGCVSQIKEKIRFNAARVIDFTKRAQIFFRSLKIFLVVISNSEPFQNFRRNVCIWAVGHETVHLFGQRIPIFQIKLT